SSLIVFFFFQAEDGIRDGHVTGVQTCALPIFAAPALGWPREPRGQLRAIDWRRRRLLRFELLDLFVLRQTLELIQEHHRLVGRQIGRASCRERVWRAAVTGAREVKILANWVSV